MDGFKESKGYVGHRLRRGGFFRERPKSPFREKGSGKASLKRDHLS